MSAFAFTTETGTAFLQCPFSAFAGKELIEYILGYIQSIHVGIEVHYPHGRQALLVDVLTAGYGLQRTTQPEGEHVDLAGDFSPTPAHNLDHQTFHDQAAWKIMTGVLAGSH